MPPFDALPFGIIRSANATWVLTFSYKTAHIASRVRSFVGLWRGRPLPRYVASPYYRGGYVTAVVLDFEVTDAEFDRLRAIVELDWYEQLTHRLERRGEMTDHDGPCGRWWANHFAADLRKLVDEAHTALTSHLDHRASWNDVLAPIATVRAIIAETHLRMRGTPQRPAKRLGAPRRWTAQRFADAMAAYPPDAPGGYRSRASWLRDHGHKISNRLARTLLKEVRRGARHGSELPRSN